jgi:hypothetical protein
MLQLQFEAFKVTVTYDKWYLVEVTQFRVSKGGYAKEKVFTDGAIAKPEASIRPLSTPFQILRLNIERNLQLHLRTFQPIDNHTQLRIYSSVLYPFYDGHWSCPQRASNNDMNIGSHHCLAM